jgi:restriction endonuclease S subunit
VTPCFENGKAAIATGLQNGIGFGSSEFIVLRPSDKVLPEVIYAFVSSEDFRESGKQQMTGTGGLHRIPTVFVRGYKVPLPPMEVQERIASEIRRLESAININAEIAGWYQKKINDVIGDI